MPSAGHPGWPRTRLHSDQPRGPAVRRAPGQRGARLHQFLPAQLASAGFCAGSLSIGRRHGDRLLRARRTLLDRNRRVHRRGLPGRSADCGAGAHRGWHDPDPDRAAADAGVVMGRIFEVRKHAMFARWNRMAQQFARIAKDINLAVKAGGSDPASNPTLRRVMQNARAVNMPKDKVEAAIKRASGRDATHYHEVLYEGYAPHGKALRI